MPGECRVNWLSRAREGLDESTVDRLSGELQRVFKTGTVTVCDRFAGYTNVPDKKTVLGVEVESKAGYSTHVAKLGNSEEVLPDYEGWQQCTAKRPFASRIFLPVTRHAVGKGRVAVIYQDAYMLFGPDEGERSPETLENVTKWAVLDDKPSPLSVERVMRQTYTDLRHWFYGNAVDNPAKAEHFYKRRVRRAIDRWSKDEWRVELRRDLVWLLSADSELQRGRRYLDPCDYVGWAFEEGVVPHTLVGRSHGDMNGRNILVGVQRGEAEYPAVFDYGEMGTQNVIAWDFAKLETELKVRLTIDLFKDQRVREKLLGPDGNAGAPSLPLLTCPTDVPKEARRLRAKQLLFGFHFENLLSDLTEQIDRLDNPAALDPPCGREITGLPKLDRALCILLRIRQEAALCFASLHADLPRKSWREEFNFAMAVYAVSVGKFNYQEYEAAFALLSGGVSAARLQSAREAIRTQIESKQHVTKPSTSSRLFPYPSYHVPLERAHRVWKERGPAATMKKTMDMLEEAVRRYKHAVPLIQEKALLLAETGQEGEAQELLRPLRDLCDVFGDFETLCRVGRLSKDCGDIALDHAPVAPADLYSHPAWQHYSTAFDVYLSAFRLREDYYPGVNAATLGFILKKPEAHSLAEEVAGICHGMPIGTLLFDDRFWVFCTEGECALLLGKSGEAARFYQHAVSLLKPDQVGMVQSAYAQLCRLWWAMGGKRVAPVLRVFEKSSYWTELIPGPLGDCGYSQEPKWRRIRSSAATST